MMNVRVVITGCSFLLLTLFISNLAWAALPPWYEAYDNGIKAMARKDYQAAVNHFQTALKDKPQDAGKMRAFGTVIIEYYPHREMGIAYYYLGNIDQARAELNTSINQSSSRRAQMFLDEIARGNYPQATTPPPTQQEPPPIGMVTPGATAVSATDAVGSEIVGDRMSIAVLPFDSKGLGNELGSIDLLDKLVTGFVGINRFKVIERALLEKILEEQKLGMSGIVDASTAAEIGKGIGVDAVVVGSVTRATAALSIDARLIDTETAAIITARDAYSNRISLQDISQMITELAEKIKGDFPIVNGYVIGVGEDKITLDIGRANGVKKGMKCHVYREGAPIVHPVSGKVIAREIDELCEVLITDAFDVYSTAKIIKVKKDYPKIRDKVVTK